MFRGLSYMGSYLNSALVRYRMSNEESTWEIKWPKSKI